MNTHQATYEGALDRFRADAEARDKAAQWRQVSLWAVTIGTIVAFGVALLTQRDGTPPSTAPIIIQVPAVPEIRPTKPPPADPGSDAR